MDKNGEFEKQIVYGLVGKRLPNANVGDFIAHYTRQGNFTIAEVEIDLYEEDQHARRYRGLGATKRNPELDPVHRTHTAKGYALSRAVKDALSHAP